MGDIMRRETAGLLFAIFLLAAANSSVAALTTSITDPGTAASSKSIAAGFKHTW